MSILFCKRYFQWKYISTGLIVMLLLTVYSYKSAISKLQDDLETQKRSMPDLHSVKEAVKEIGFITET